MSRNFPPKLPNVYSVALKWPNKKKWVIDYTRYNHPNEARKYCAEMLRKFPGLEAIVVKIRRTVEEV